MTVISDIAKPRPEDTRTADRLAETAQDAANAMPLDAAELKPSAQQLATPQIRFTGKTDRFDPRAETREVVNFQRQLDKVVAAIKTFQATATKDSNLSAIAEMVTALYNSIDLDLKANFNERHQDRTKIWSKDSFPRIFKEEFAPEYKEALAKMKTLRYDAEAKKERAELSSRLIDFYKYTIKLRLKQVETFIREDQSSPKQICSQILPMLVQADVSANKLRTELNWSKNKSETRMQTRDMQTLDTLGKTVWGVDLSKFDINIQEGQPTTIRQRTWVRPYSYLASILPNLRKKDTITANEKLEALIDLYSPNSSRKAFLSKTSEIHQGLTTLAQTLEEEATELKQGRVSDTIKKQVETIQALITPPEQAHPIYKDFHFSKDPAAALRSRVYTLQNNIEDFLTVSKVISYLENLAGDEEGLKRSVYNVPGLLSTASSAGFLSKDDLETISSDLEQITAWLNNGNVDPKQDARAPLAPVTKIVSQGYQAEKSGNITEAVKQYRYAAKLINQVVSSLKERLTELTGISHHTKAKFDALLIGYKDLCLKVIPTELIRLFKAGEYTQAKDEIKKIRSLYFNHIVPEPGYRRVANQLAHLEDLIDRSATELEPGTGSARKLPSHASVNDFEYHASLIPFDIDHKRELRLTVFDLDKASRGNPAQASFVFVPAHQSEAKFLQARSHSHIAFKNPPSRSEAGFRAASGRVLEDDTEYFISSSNITGLTPPVSLGKTPLPLRTC